MISLTNELHRPPFEQWAANGVAFSVAVLDVGTGELLAEHQQHLVLNTASVGKLFLLIEIARRAEAGELSLDDAVMRTPSLSVADSGLWHTLAMDSVSIGDACLLIGSVSDNLATNVLLELVGIGAVLAITATLGFRDSALLDRVRQERMPQHPPTLSRGSAAELASLLARLHTGDIVSPAVSARVLDWIALNTDLSMVASAFGLDPLAHAEADLGVLLRNKTGTISTARIDVGVVQYAGRALAYAVLANWDDTIDSGRRDALRRMAELGEWLRAELGAP